MDFDVKWLRRTLNRFFAEHERRTGETQGALARRAGLAEGGLRDFLGDRSKKPDPGGPKWATLVKIAAAAETNVFDMLRPEGRGGAQAPAEGLMLDPDAVAKILAKGYAVAKEANLDIAPEVFADEFVRSCKHFMALNQKKAASDISEAAQEFAENVIPVVFARDRPKT